jgi:hypothetical protein
MDLDTGKTLAIIFKIFTSNKNRLFRSTEENIIRLIGEKFTDLEYLGLS